jgi:hypothetical protein
MRPAGKNRTHSPRDTRAYWVTEADKEYQVEIDILSSGLLKYHRWCPYGYCYCFRLNISSEFSFAGSGDVKSIASSSQTCSRSAWARSASFRRVATVRKHFGQMESSEPSGFRLRGKDSDRAVPLIIQPLSILRGDVRVAAFYAEWRSPMNTRKFFVDVRSLISSRLANSR